MVSTVLSQDSGLHFSPVFSTNRSFSRVGSKMKNIHSQNGKGFAAD
jgi:hypothetical protein